MTTPVACWCCDWMPIEGQDWAYFGGPQRSGNPDYCEHVNGMRYCGSCSEWWWRPGLDADWDITGCAHEDCPACVAWAASDEGKAEMARQAAGR